MAQALTLRTRTHCRGGDVSFFDVFAKLGLTGFDRYGAPGGERGTSSIRALDDEMNT